MEEGLQQRNVSGVWRGLKTICGYKEPDSQVRGDQQWVNDLNIFIKRFNVLKRAPSLAYYPTPTPPPADGTLSLTTNQVRRELQKCKSEEDSGSRWHQLEGPQILCGSAVWDCGVSVQPEPEAREGTTTVEDVFGTCAKDPSPQGLQQLPAGGADIIAD